MTTVYQVQCQSCAHTRDAEAPFGHPELVGPCPVCQNTTYNILLSPTPFILQGPGWAKDLYDKTKK